MLLGLTEPTAGTAEIAGCDCTRNPLEVKSMVGYLPDNVGFYGDMTGQTESEVYRKTERDAWKGAGGAD